MSAAAQLGVQTRRRLRGSRGITAAHSEPGNPDQTGDSIL